MSESIMYHIDNDISIVDNVYRYGSEQFFTLVNEMRELYNNKVIDLSEDNKEVVESDLRKKAIYEGEEVWLDLIYEKQAPKSGSYYKGKKVELNKPKRGGSKKFYVYVKNDKGNVIKVEFGAKDGGGNLAVKIKDPKARKAFADRHDCKNKKDKTKPGYWACRTPRFSKSIGLSGGGNYFW